MGERADRRDRLRSLLVFRVPVGLGLLLCASDQARIAQSAVEFDTPLWTLLFWGGTAVAALSAASAGLLAPRTGTAVRFGKAIFGLHIGVVLFWAAWGLPSILIMAFR